MTISTRPKKKPNKQTRKKKNKAETPRKTPHTKKDHRAAELIPSVPEGGVPRCWECRQEL